MVKQTLNGTKIPTAKTSMNPLTLKRPTNESPEILRKHESSEMMSLPPPPSFRIDVIESQRNSRLSAKEKKKQSAKKQTLDLRKRLYMQRCSDNQNDSDNESRDGSPIDDSMISLNADVPQRAGNSRDSSTLKKILESEESPKISHRSSSEGQRIRSEDI